MKVLVACEFSGIVRDAFIDKGHDAISCDLIPSEVEGPHIQGDALNILNDGWDLIIAHPPCTYLCNSGVRWLHEREGRWDCMVDACDFFMEFLNANRKKIAVENPIPHKYAVQCIGRKYDQLIQPYQFGHPESKATCLWLKGLKPLTHTKAVKPTEQRVHNLFPSKDRSKERSRFFTGIAEAMADQWT